MKTKAELIKAIVEYRRSIGMGTPVGSLNVMKKADIVNLTKEFYYGNGTL